MPLRQDQTSRTLYRGLLVPDLRNLNNRRLSPSHPAPGGRQLLAPADLATVSTI